MPLDTRLYRRPWDDLARLTVDRVTGPGGQRWWSVSLVREEDDVQAVAGQPAIAWLRTRAEARAAYRERLAALRGGGVVESVRRAAARTPDAWQRVHRPIPSH